jgi:hypothetical protein
MTKSTISITRLQDGSVDVAINTFGDAPATATINVPADVAKIMGRDLTSDLASSFTWANE